MTTIKTIFFPHIIFTLACITILLFQGCGGSEEEPELLSASEQERAALFNNVPDTNDSPTTNNKKPTETSDSLILADDKDAARLLWVYITQCVSIDITDIKVNTALADEWIAMPTDTSPQQFGAWRINKSGLITPHNSHAKEWNLFVESQCDSQIMQPSATDVLNDSDAISVLWTQLAKCNPELTINYLTSKKDKKTGSWVVVTSPNSNDDYGVWNVDRDASITPLNSRADQVWKELKVLLPADTDTDTDTDTDSANSTVNHVTTSKCSPVIRTIIEAKNRTWSHLSSCYPNIKVGNAIWDPGEHIWLVVTEERTGTELFNAKPSLWKVFRDGSIVPGNSSAILTGEVITNHII